MRIKALALPLFLLVVLVVCIEVPVAAAPAPPPPTPPPPATLIWDDPGFAVNDVTLSKDGEYVAVAAYIPEASGQVRFYNRSSGTPMWTWTSEASILSVAISAYGDYVAASNGTRVLYWSNARGRTLGDTEPTWSSTNLGIVGEDPRCLDMSDDGDSVVACGSGESVYYWNETTQKSSWGEAFTWSCSFEGSSDVKSVDISSDGDYVVAGVSYGSSGTSGVAYWKGAKSESGFVSPYWTSTDLADQHVSVEEVAVSDDGEYVAAATSYPAPSGVYYWAGATGFGEGSDPDRTWNYTVPEGGGFLRIDMSSDGDRVVAGAEGSNAGVYFFDGAKSLTGELLDPSWFWDSEYGWVSDVAINDAGDYMAAGTRLYHVLFFGSESNEPKWDYGPLDFTVAAVSISSDGGALAFGTNPGIDTAFYIDTGYPMRPPSARPVGGLLTPVNKLQFVTPYLSLIGLLGAVTVAVAIQRRRRA